MYGVYKQIKTEISAITSPSYGTIKPALKRLELSGFISTQRSMSKGGRPSTYYSITEAGRNALKNCILEELSDNPIQFLQNARVKLYCADVLDDNEMKKLLAMLKIKAEYYYNDTINLVKNNQENFYYKIVSDNINCEYKNFISLLEGIERACKY